VARLEAVVGLGVLVAMLVMVSLIDALIRAIVRRTKSKEDDHDVEC
jgi:hypothetical protein